MKWMFLLIAAWSAPALADTTADYRSAAGASFHFEISSGGDIRYSGASPGNAIPSYVVVHGDQIYNVVGGTAYRSDDYAAVVGELMGLGSGATAAAMARMPAMDLVERGTETVRGRAGRAFYIRMLSSGATTSWSGFVISDDKRLAELGSGVARFYRAASALTEAQFGGGPFFKLAQQVLGTGTPIRLFRDFELDAVDYAPIPTERFAIPTKTGTRDELRAWFIARRKGAQ